MGDIKHTLPWLLRTITDEELGYEIGLNVEDTNGHSIISMDSDYAEFIVQACNSYYPNQETIRELVEALSVLRTTIDDLAVEIGNNQDLQLIIDTLHHANLEAETALSRAKEAQS